SSPHWAPTSVIAGIAVYLFIPRIGPRPAPDVPKPLAQEAAGALAHKGYTTGKSRSEAEAGTAPGGPAALRSALELPGRGLAAVPQEGGAPLRLLGLLDRLGGLAEVVQRTQEAAVGLVLPRDRAVPLPPVAAQLVQAPVVAGARVGVGGDVLPRLVGAFGERGPGRRVLGEARRDLGRIGPRGQRLAGLRQVGQLGGRRTAQQVLLQLHAPILPGGARESRHRRGPRKPWSGGPVPRSAPRRLLHAGAGGLQLLRGLDDAGGHARLGGLAVGPRVVGLLVADVAVDLQHTVVVLHDVVDDGPGERVLGVGVDVHLHHAVGDRLVDLLDAGPGAAVEDQVERLLLAVLGAHRLLDVLEHGRTQLHEARLVHAVHVAEGQRGDVVALLAEAEHLGGAQAVAGRGVQLLVELADDAVLLTADDADLDLQDGAGLLGGGQQLLGDLQVLLELHRGAVPHVRLEQRLLPPGHALLGDLQQRAHEAVELLLRAVVGVQRDVHRVLVGHDPGVLGE